MQICKIEFKKHNFGNNNFENSNLENNNFEEMEQSYLGVEFGWMRG